MPACIILNPRAGRGRAHLRIAPWLDRFPVRPTIFETRSAGDGRTRALEAVHAGYEQVIAAGGDGTVHEVACGLIESHDSRVRLGVLPIGSANDFAWSIGKQVLAHRVQESSDQKKASENPRLHVDVGQVEDGKGRIDYFIESIGLGLSGCVTQESKKIEWLQGMPLYALAAVKALFRYQPQLLQITIDEHSFRIPTLLFSVLLGRREGSFVFAPEAFNDDGWFDYILASNLGRWKAMTLIPRIAAAGPPKNHPHIRMGKCKKVTIESDEELYAHTDGELFAVPGNGIRRLTISLLPARLEVEIYSHRGASKDENA